MSTDFGIIPQAYKAFKRSTIAPIKPIDDFPDETPIAPDIFNIF